MDPLPLAGTFDHGAVLAGIEADLDALDAALRRMDDGSYGRCNRCGAALPADGLDADPLRVACEPGCAP